MVRSHVRPSKPRTFCPKPLAHACLVMRAIRVKVVRTVLPRYPTGSGASLASERSCMECCGEECERPRNREGGPRAAQRAGAVGVEQAGGCPGEDAGRGCEAGDDEAGGPEGGEERGKEYREGGGRECDPVAQAEVGVGGENA